MVRGGAPADRCRLRAALVSAATSLLHKGGSRAVRRRAGGAGLGGDGRGRRRRQRARRAGGGARAHGRHARRVRALPGGRRRRARRALRRGQPPRARRAAHHAAPLLGRLARRPGGGAGRGVRARRRPSAARGRGLARRPHPRAVPGGGGARCAGRRRAHRLLAAGRGARRRRHGPARKRAARVAHGAQPARRRARAARARRAPRRRGARAHRAPVRRRLHRDALRVRLRGGVLCGGDAERQADASRGAAAVPVRRRRPVPAARGAARGRGGEVGARGARDHGAWRTHRLPGGAVAGAPRRRPVHRAARAAVLRRAAGPAAAAALGALRSPVTAGRGRDTCDREARTRTTIELRKPCTCNGRREKRSTIFVSDQVSIDFILYNLEHITRIYIASERCADLRRMNSKRFSTNNIN